MVVSMASLIILLTSSTTNWSRNFAHLFSTFVPNDTPPPPLPILVRDILLLPAWSESNRDPQVSNHFHFVALHDKLQSFSDK
uniref:Secreted protein n=1 Tax=Anopheles atroparvus TaxID=41427 RepID=A0AAG5D4U6_ANOAO